MIRKGHKRLLPNQVNAATAAQRTDMLKFRGDWRGCLFGCKQMSSQNKRQRALPKKYLLLVFMVSEKLV